MNRSRRTNQMNHPCFLLTVTAVLSLLGISFPAPAAGGPEISRTNLLAYVDRAGQVQPVKRVEDWMQRRRAIVAAMETVMGRFPGAEKRCPLAIEQHEEVDMGSYLRRRISYAAEPGGRVPAYLLIPKAALRGATRHPAVLALHQTRSEGHKVVVGLANSPDDEYGVHLAERGFVVLAPPYTMLADYWPDLRSLGYESGTMKSIWDNVRGLDLLSALPFVKTNGFGVIGHSLGGHNGVYTAVFDPRIQVVVTSCGLDSYRDYYDGDPKVWQPERGWCQQRYMPKLASYAGRLHEIPFDFHEIIGALAPRICFISAPIGDTNFRWRSVDTVAAAANAVYQLYGKPGNLQVAHPDGPHRFPPEMRERAYQLLKENL
jgi:dienelactone hydrolase